MPFQRHNVWIAAPLEPLGSASPIQIGDLAGLLEFHGPSGPAKKNTPARMESPSAFSG